MNRTLSWLAMTATMGTVIALGQENAPDSASTPLALPRGFHIYSVSVYNGYSSLAYPFTGVATSYSSPISGLGSDVVYGGLISAGWQRHRTKSDLAVTYSGGYEGMARYSDLNALNHSLAFTLSRRLRTRWEATLTGSGQDHTMAQYLFEPSRFSAMTSAPASFDDFAAAVGVGQFSNAQIASALTGAPIMESPARSLILGNRVLGYAMNAGLSYSPSSRLKLRASAFSAAGQARLSGSEAQPPWDYVMPRSTGGHAGIGGSYMLSPRTDIGFDVGEYMVWNHFQRAHGTSATASLGRKMSAHWFLRIYGGGSLTNVVTNNEARSPIRQGIGGGTLGIMTYSHTLAASYDRSASDSYGFAVGANVTESASWHWRRPGSRWSAFAGFGQQQLRNTGFLSVSGWRATGGLSMRVQRHSAVTLEYSHLRSSGTFTGSFNEFSVDSVRLSFGWTPAITR